VKPAKPKVSTRKVVWEGPWRDSTGKGGTEVLELQFTNPSAPGGPEFTGSFGGLRVARGRLVRGASIDDSYLYWQHNLGEKQVVRAWAVPKGPNSSPFSSLHIVYHGFQGGTETFSGAADVDAKE
jgi:hypothetical protein